MWDQILVSQYQIHVSHELNITVPFGAHQTDTQKGVGDTQKGVGDKGTEGGSGQRASGKAERKEKEVEDEEEDEDSMMRNRIKLWQHNQESSKRSFRQRMENPRTHDGNWLLLLLCMSVHASIKAKKRIL